MPRPGPSPDELVRIAGSHQIQRQKKELAKQRDEEEAKLTPEERELRAKKAAEPKPSIMRTSPFIAHDEAGTGHR
jgi:hypothetical protein